MITLLIVVVYFISNLAMVISNKSNFKVLFSFFTSFIVFTFLNNLEYQFASYYLSFVTLMNFISLGYVKFSQTGKVRVLPSNRNRLTNNLIPVLSVLVSSLLVILLLNSVSDEILELDILTLSEGSENYFNSMDISFISLITIPILLIYLSKRVRE